MAKISTKKTATKKTPAKKTDAATSLVTVRMYLQGLGDCFLLQFKPKSGDNFNVLIDCGIYKASGKASKIMNDVVDDIIATTRTKEFPDGHLDLLVITHEHWDHVSGFVQALDKFEKMAIDCVWQAWTEDENDPVAADLLQKYRKAGAALMNALRKAAEHPAAKINGDSEANKLDDAFEVMNFFGADRNVENDSQFFNIKKSDDKKSKPEKFSDYEKIKIMLSKKKKLRYLAPGAVEPIGKTGVTAFVLGPPKDLKAIGTDDPGAKDGYHKQKTAFFDGFNAMLSAAESGLWTEEDEERTHPFGSKYEISVEQARESEYFQNLYDFDNDLEHPENFRNIDDLAFETLGNLALRLDSHLNNTSLVLAFQLPSGDVLLFPGDAQSGNWKSWADLDRPLKFKKEMTDAHELLAKTVFYKVSHHGSHNATPKTFGLELMTNPKLRAMVPVDFNIAQQAKYGEMPLVEIMNELKKRTKDTILRSDDFPDLTEPPEGFRLAEKGKVLEIETKKNGTFLRPRYVETDFPMNDEE